MLARAKPSLDLGIAQIRVALDERSGIVEKACYFFIRHKLLPESPSLFFWFFGVIFTQHHKVVVQPMTEKIESR